MQTQCAPTPLSAVAAADYLRNSSSLFGIFDAAKDQRVSMLAERSGENAVCMYNGDAAANLQQVAPYIIEFQGCSDLLDLSIEMGMQNHWGLWFESAMDLAACKSHFRKFYRIQFPKPDSRWVYFRFFDPRVFVPFLETCDAQQTEDITKGISTVICQGQKENCLFYKF